FYMWLEAHRQDVIDQELNLSELPNGFDGMKLFFISDIHRRKISWKIINEVKDRADLVIICGDLTEKYVPFRRMKENINRLLLIGPVYFVWGNHDYDVDFRRLDAFLLDKRVTILENTAVQLESG